MQLLRMKSTKNSKPKTLSLDKLTVKHSDRRRVNFYASDFGRSDLDIYFSFTNEPKTNAAEWFQTLKWGAGLGVEEKLLRILKDSGYVPEEYDQKKHGRILIEREGVSIAGYIDAATTLDETGIPIEIKSINNKNSVDIRKYATGYPRESYVGQLAVYMDARNVNMGYLFVASVDGLSYFLFKATRLKDGRVKCGKVTVNPADFYKRVSKLKKDHIDLKKMPDVNQYLYKYPVDTLNWKEVPVASIAKARQNKKVIGDFQIVFSDWKDKIIKLQKTKKGYSNAELKIILEKTKGYSTWKKKTIKKVAKKK